MASVLMQWTWEPIHLGKPSETLIGHDVSVTAMNMRADPSGKTTWNFNKTWLQCYCKWKQDEIYFCKHVTIWQDMALVLLKLSLRKSNWRSVNCNILEKELLLSCSLSPSRCHWSRLMGLIHAETTPTYIDEW